MKLAEQIYKLTSNLPKSEVYGLSSQAQRSAVSIPSNIAEGFRRSSPLDFIRFLRIAYGSCAELETQVELMASIYNVPEVDEILPLIGETSRMINGMIISIKVRETALSTKH